MPRPAAPFQNHSDLLFLSSPLLPRQRHRGRHMSAEVLLLSEPASSSERRGDGSGSREGLDSLSVLGSVPGTCKDHHSKASRSHCHCHLTHVHDRAPGTQMDGCDVRMGCWERLS